MVLHDRVEVRVKQRADARRSGEGREVIPGCARVGGKSEVGVPEFGERVPSAKCFVQVKATLRIGPKDIVWISQPCG